MKEMCPEVLVVDDEEIIRESCRRILEGSGYRAECVPDGATSLERLKEARYDVVLTDLKMPDMSGLKVLEAIQGVASDVPVIVITGYASVESAVEAMKLGALDYVKKPFTPDELRDIVEKALHMRERWQKRRRRAELLQELHRTAHETLSLRDILDLIAERAVHATGAEASSLSLMNPKEGNLRLLAAFGISEETLRDEEFQEDWATLSVPLVHRHREIGLLRIYTETPNAFSEEDTSFLHEVADRVGPSLENALAFESLSEEYESLKNDLWEWYDDDVWRLQGGKSDRDKERP